MIKKFLFFHKEHEVMNDHITNCYLYGGVSKDSSRIEVDQRRTDPVMD